MFDFEHPKAMGKVLITTALLVILSIPNFLGLGDLFIFLFLAAFGVSGYFADESGTILSRELMVVRNVLAVVVAFGVGIFLLLNTSNFQWALSICLPFGLICLVGKQKYIIWAFVWILFALVLAKGFDLLMVNYFTTEPPTLALICAPVLAIKFLDILTVIILKNSSREN